VYEITTACLWETTTIHVSKDPALGLSTYFSFFPHRIVQESSQPANNVQSDKVNFHWPSSAVVCDNHNAKLCARSIVEDHDHSSVWNTLQQRFAAYPHTKHVYAYSHSLMFYNVCTIYESTKDKSVGIVLGRRALLDEFLHQFGANIVGMAETRSRARRMNTQNYIVIAGGLDKNSLGMEVWISKRFPVQDSEGGSKFVRIMHNHVCKVFASPRILLVSVLVNNQNVFILTFHAPHEQWELHVRKEFFLQLGRVADLARGGILFPWVM